MPHLLRVKGAEREGIMLRPVIAGGLASVFAMLVFVGGSSAVSQNAARGGLKQVGFSAYVPGQVIVRFRAGATKQARASVLSSEGTSAVQTLALPRTELTRVEPGLSV